MIPIGVASQNACEMLAMSRKNHFSWFDFPVAGRFERLATALNTITW
jgi:hypothetical protein